MSLRADGHRYRAGIDLGGTKIEIVVLDDSFDVQHRRRVPTPATDYCAILSTITNLVVEADNLFGCSLPVGIGTPGSISPQTELLRNSNTVCMNGQRFADDIQRRLERRVRVQNDANCFVLSEVRHGAARGALVAFGVIVGTGTGGGLVVNGKLIEGRQRIAGEWGHNPLPWLQQSDGVQSCYCGKLNCIETFLSGPGMAKRYGAGLNSKQIVKAAAAGEPRAVRMMSDYFDQFSRALAGVINVLDPDIIVLGGGMSGIESIYTELPRRLKKYVFSDFVDTPIVAAEHGDASGVFGAAMLID